VFLEFENEPFSGKQEANGLLVYRVKIDLAPKAVWHSAPTALGWA